MGQTKWALRKMTVARCRAFGFFAAAILALAPLITPNETRAQTSPEVVLSEASRLAPAELGYPLTDNPRITGGDGLVYVAGFEERSRWATVDPTETQLQIFDVAEEHPNVRMALGSEDGRRFVMHDGRISVFPGTGFPEYAFEVPGRPLAARAWPEGPVSFLFWSGSREASSTVTLVSFRPQRSAPEQVKIALPAGVTPGLGMLGESAVFVTNRDAPYDLTVSTLEGMLIGRWVRDAPWIKTTLDEFGRPNTHVFAIHETGAYSLVVTAVREDDAEGVFGGYQGFAEKNRFVLEVIHTTSGTVVDTSVHEEPPFHGSLGKDLVFRILEGGVRGAREIVFLAVSIP